MTCMMTVYNDLYDDYIRSKHMKGSKERCLLGQDKTSKLSG